MATTARDSAANARTMRTDVWWLQPLLTVLVLGGFIVYATYRTFENDNFLTEWSQRRLWESGGVGELLSPLYSPLFAIDWKILGYHVSPALLILPFPLTFRLTCYYYRKAYYRAFFWNPPACAVVGGKSQNYTGERRFPFVIQNLHRFAFYAAFLFIFILGYDVILSMKYADGWGFSVATLVMAINVVLLALYTFGCHSFRHLVGGSINCYSCSLASKTRYGLWKQVSFLNDRHALFAWLSLFSVSLTDVYITLVCRGTLHDFVIARF